MARLTLRSRKPVSGDHTDPQGLAALAERFLDWLEIRNYTEQTVRTRCHGIGYFIVWCEDRGVTRPIEVTRAVLERCEGALGSTSLNLTGASAARTVAAARSTLAGMDDPGAPVLLLEAGDLRGPPPSTLLSLRDDTPRLLREGAIEAARLQAVLGLELAT